MILVLVDCAFAVQRIFTTTKGTLPGRDIVEGQIQMNFPAIRLRQNALPPTLHFLPAHTSLRPDCHCANSGQIT